MGGSNTPGLGGSFESVHVCLILVPERRNWRGWRDIAFLTTAV